jgi:hypothetical protein
MGIAISSAFFPHGFHLFALVTQFAEAGYKKAMHVFTPGVAFGFAHAGYFNQGVLRPLKRHPKGEPLENCSFEEIGRWAGVLFPQ